MPPPPPQITNATFGHWHKISAFLGDQLWQSRWKLLYKYVSQPKWYDMYVNIWVIDVITPFLPVWYDLPNPIVVVFTEKLNACASRSKSSTPDQDVPDGRSSAKTHGKKTIKDKKPFQRRMSRSSASPTKHKS